eukprot:SAG22_NODE_11162_length_497_cov_1.688442_1_plen_91_part_00
MHQLDTDLAGRRVRLGQADAALPDTALQRRRPDHHARHVVELLERDGAVGCVRRPDACGEPTNFKPKFKLGKPQYLSISHHAVAHAPTSM